MYSVPDSVGQTSAVALWGCSPCPAARPCAALSWRCVETATGHSSDSDYGIVLVWVVLCRGLRAAGWVAWFPVPVREQVGSPSPEAENGQDLIWQSDADS